ncbi:MAG: GNAT family N-acetyltransferase [Cyclobacteriaceae bacterium]|nr:GNAT family N-acetyltransferase [Cyclobacteriaceae bacterium]
MNLSFKPLSLSSWEAFEELFGERGACGGCWCMYWRLKNTDYEKQKGLGNKNAIKTLIEKKYPIGIIAYENEKPIGWCATAPRAKYLRLENSRILKRIDDKPVWSIVCFFIDKKFRGKGISVELIKEAAVYAIAQGATIIEAYPQIPKKDKIPPVFAYTGLASAFTKAGFKEVARRSETRPIMRYYKGVSDCRL